MSVYSLAASGVVSFAPLVISIISNIQKVGNLAKEFTSVQYSLESLSLRVQAIDEPLRFCVDWSTRRNSTILRGALNQAEWTLKQCQDTLDKVCNEKNKASELLKQAAFAKRVDQLLNDLSFALSSLSMAIATWVALQQHETWWLSPSSLIRSSVLLLGQTTDNDSRASPAPRKRRRNTMMSSDIAAVASVFGKGSPAVSRVLSGMSHDENGTIVECEGCAFFQYATVSRRTQFKQRLLSCRATIVRIAPCQYQLIVQAKPRDDSDGESDIEDDVANSDDDGDDNVDGDDDDDAEDGDGHNDPFLDNDDDDNNLVFTFDLDQIQEFQRCDMRDVPGAIDQNGMSFMWTGVTTSEVTPKSHLTRGRYVFEPEKSLPTNTGGRDTLKRWKKEGVSSSSSDESNTRPDVGRSRGVGDNGESFDRVEVFEMVAQLCRYETQKKQSFLQASDEELWLILCPFNGRGDVTSPPTMFSSPATNSRAPSFAAATGIAPGSGQFNSNGYKSANTTPRRFSSVATSAPTSPFSPQLPQSHYSSPTLSPRPLKAKQKNRRKSRRQSILPTYDPDTPVFGSPLSFSPATSSSPSTRSKESSGSFVTGSGNDHVTKIRSGRRHSMNKSPASMMRRRGRQKRMSFGGALPSQSVPPSSTPNSPFGRKGFDEETASGGGGTRQGGRQRSAISSTSSSSVSSPSLHATRDTAPPAAEGQQGDCTENVERLRSYGTLPNGGESDEVTGPNDGESDELTGGTLPIDEVPGGGDCEDGKVRDDIEPDGQVEDQAVVEEVEPEGRVEEEEGEANSLLYVEGGDKRVYVGRGRLVGEFKPGYRTSVCSSGDGDGDGDGGSGGGGGGGDVVDDKANRDPECVHGRRSARVGGDGDNANDNGDCCCEAELNFERQLQVCYNDAVDCDTKSTQELRPSSLVVCGTSLVVADPACSGMVFVRRGHIDSRNEPTNGSDEGGGDEHHDDDPAGSVLVPLHLPLDASDQSVLNLFPIVTGIGIDSGTHADPEEHLVVVSSRAVFLVDLQSSICMERACVPLGECEERDPGSGNGGDGTNNERIVGSAFAGVNPPCGGGSDGPAERSDDSVWRVAVLSSRGRVWLYDFASGPGREENGTTHSRPSFHFTVPLDDAAGIDDASAEAMCRVTGVSLCRGGLAVAVSTLDRVLLFDLSLSSPQLPIQAPSLPRFVALTTTRIGGDGGFANPLFHSRPLASADGVVTKTSDVSLWFACSAENKVHIWELPSMDHPGSCCVHVDFAELYQAESTLQAQVLDPHDDPIVQLRWWDGEHEHERESESESERAPPSLVLMTLGDVQLVSLQAKPSKRAIPA